MTSEKMRELLLARESAVTAENRADALLLEMSAELQELHLVVGMVCAHLSFLTSIEAPLVDHLRELPDRMDHVVAEGICRGGGITLDRMVSHFDEI